MQACDEDAERSIGRGVTRRPTLDHNIEIWYTWRARISSYRALTFFFFANLRLLIKTPKVLEVARSHFACSTLEGVELEDDGGSG